MKGWLALVLCLCLGLSGCGGWAEYQQIDRLQSQVEELQRELETIQGASAPGIEQPVPWWEEWLPWKVAWRMLAQESKRDTKSEGQYWCMGKGDSCQNPTSGPLDLYCDSCDPDGDNREG